MIASMGLCAVFSPSVMSDSLGPMDCNPPGSSVHGDSPGKNTGVRYHALLQGTFPTLGSNPCLLRLLVSCIGRWVLHHLPTLLLLLLLLLSRFSRVRLCATP